MTELEKIIYTKSFVDKLANGINPLDGTDIPKNDLFNEVRISRCMFYISNLLDEIIQNGGIKKKSSEKNKLPLKITEKQVSGINFSEEFMTVSNITEEINKTIDTDIYKKLKVTSITEWLVIKEILYNEIENNKSTRKPTLTGKNLGITTKKCSNDYREYEVVLYNREAQKFIIDNIYEIVDYQNNGKNK